MGKTQLEGRADEHLHTSKRRELAYRIRPDLDFFAFMAKILSQWHQ